MRNRAKCSMSQSFNFNRLDNDIYVSCMDSSTAGTNVRQCSRCKSIWHISRIRLSQDHQDGQCPSRSVFLGTQADARVTLVQGCTTYAKVVGVMNPCSAAGIVPDSIAEISKPSMLQHQILCQEGVNQDPKVQDQTPQVTTHQQGRVG